jgi:CRISPR-associated protein Cas2
MLVVLANHIPPAVRGRMKLWFVEPRPNVFVSGIKDSTADKVVSYLFEHCQFSSGLVVFQKTNKAPGYKIRSLGNASRELTEISGLQLILEKSGSVS